MNPKADTHSPVPPTSPPSPNNRKWLYWGFAAFGLMVALAALKGGSKPPALPPVVADTESPFNSLPEAPEPSSKMLMDWPVDDADEKPAKLGAQPAGGGERVVASEPEDVPPLEDPVPVARREVSKTAAGTVDAVKQPAAIHAPAKVTQAPKLSSEKPSPEGRTAATSQDTPASRVKPKKEAGGVEFVTPRNKKTGVVSQSRTLLEEKQVVQILPPKTSASSTPPSAEPVESAAPAAPVRLPRSPALVQRSEAAEIARKLTQQMKEKGIISTKEEVRLPKANETGNTKIWREEDAPKEPTERRPVGLIIAETEIDSHGFPVRANIPAGHSPLEKTGPDVPLWKRPEH